MNLPIPPRIVTLTTIALILGSGCRRQGPHQWQGYVEGEFVYIGAPVPGVLLERPIERGAQVEQGNLLFVLEAAAEQAAVTEAERRLAASAARLENLLKGRRPTEIAALEAQVERQRANFELAKTELARREELARQNVISDAELDQVRTQRESAQAALEEAEAQLATARLGGRDDEVQASTAERDAAQAALERARWALDQKTQRAPVAGRIHDTLFRPGEFVPAGQPVVALLPPANIRVRFFVPQAQLAEVPPGTAVAVKGDGADEVDGTVNYVSTRAEFTPPVIYSREARAKLVFLVEATFPPALATHLQPGQPVDVRLQSATPASRETP